VIVLTTTRLQLRRQLVLRTAEKLRRSQPQLFSRGGIHTAKFPYRRTRKVTPLQSVYVLDITCALWRSEPTPNVASMRSRDEVKQQHSNWRWAEFSASQLLRNHIF
jgi:hypothetical protein